MQSETFQHTAKITKDPINVITQAGGQAGRYKEAKTKTILTKI